MKTIIYTLAIFITLNAASQVKKSPHKNLAGKKSKVVASNYPANNITSNGTLDTASTVVQPRQSITEQRLNGGTTATKVDRSGTAAPGTSKSSSFVGGIYPAANANKTFDTSGANVNNTMNIAFTNTGGNSTDTVGNVNTLNQGPVTTTSGTVDRSGQAQFGQTNWGEARSVVGESQWTVPPPVTTAFNKEFPSITDATWTRNNLDSTIFSAKYRSGNYWITANYNAIGERLETRTEIPYSEAPRAIKNLYSTRFNGIDIVTINRIQVMGKRDMYELKTRNGRTIYLNNEGAEINY